MKEAKKEKPTVAGHSKTLIHICICICKYIWISHICVYAFIKLEYLCLFCARPNNQCPKKISYTQQTIHSYMYINNIHTVLNVPNRPVVCYMRSYVQCWLLSPCMRSGKRNKRSVCFELSESPHKHTHTYMYGILEMICEISYPHDQPMPNNALRFSPFLLPFFYGANAGWTHDASLFNRYMWRYYCCCWCRFTLSGRFDACVLPSCVCFFIPRYFLESLVKSKQQKMEKLILRESSGRSCYIINL